MHLHEAWWQGDVAGLPSAAALRGADGSVPTAATAKHMAGDPTTSLATVPASMLGMLLRVAEGASERGALAAALSAKLPGDHASRARTRERRIDTARPYEGNSFIGISFDIKTGDAEVTLTSLWVMSGATMADGAECRIAVCTGSSMGPNKATDAPFRVVYRNPTTVTKRTEYHHCALDGPCAQRDAEGVAREGLVLPPNTVTGMVAWMPGRTSGVAFAGDGVGGVVALADDTLEVRTARYVSHDDKFSSPRTPFIHLGYKVRDRTVGL